MNSVVTSLLTSLGITLIAELSLSLLLGISGKDLAIIAAANLLTNPAVNYCAYWAIFLFTYRNPYTILIILILELLAVFIEFLIYKPLLRFERFGKLKLSFLLNGASFLAGIIVILILNKKI